MVPMNHCFQSLTGSFFFPIFSLLSCLLFLSTLFFPPLCASLSLFSSFSLLLSVLFSVRLFLTSPGTKDSFYDILHGVVLSVVLQPILSPGEHGLGHVFFVTRSRFRCWSFFSIAVGCMCMHERQEETKVLHMYVCLHMCMDE